MLRSLPALICLAFLVGCSTAPEKAPELSWRMVWKTAGFDGPESAYYDAASDSLFITNIAGDGATKDGKGWISKARADGTIIKEKWATGFDSPKGLRAHKGVLYFSDIDQVVGVKITDASEVERYKIEGAKFLNDMAIAADGTLYVSDLLASKIYQIANGKVSVFAEGEDLEYPNGLLVQGDKLVVCGWGKPNPDFTTPVLGRLFTLDLKTKQKTLITRNPTGNLDGIEADGAGGYYITDWMNGDILHIAADGKTTTEFTLTQGAADHAYVDGVLIIPRMKDNVVEGYRK